MNDLFRSTDAGLFGRRLRHERGARIPVIVVTGFLGAGKTTLVKNFIESEAGHGTAIVVNEFGAAGIDDALLRSSADETVLLGNGCLCCNVRSDLQVALRKLVTDRERGLIPHFQRVVIETSGLADPGPILRTFATDRALGGEYYVEAVVTAADAVNGAATLDAFPEARRQAIMADTIVVTKTDIASSGQDAALVAQLRSLNPRARVVTSDHGDVDDSVFASDGASSLHDGEIFIAEAMHADRIVSFTLTWDRPLAWPVVARTMETLMALRGSDILRAKGILNVEGCAGPVIVQFVQHLAHPPAELQTWPDGDRISRLVFITRNIGEQDVKSLFEAVARLNPSP
ncbi:CobW family GTP-binding protein [Pseudorhodoplanes sinuspersici]|nr:GTP-binding protein [Pseudorhodoplanes sinuspersici]RKE72208.1 G3E family GTPase [Pseudorhodoplanes sinuspersici]